MRKKHMNEDSATSFCNQSSEEALEVSVDFLTKLPEAEFEVMSVVWRNTPPLTTLILMNQVGNEKGWKLQTLLSLLLPEKAFTN